MFEDLAMSQRGIANVAYMATFLQTVKAKTNGYLCTFQSLISQAICLRVLEFSNARETIQRVEIYYKIIGQVQIPKLSRSERDSYKKSFVCTKKEQIAC